MYRAGFGGSRLPDRRITSVKAFCLASALAALLAGCSGFGSELTENIKEGNYFQRPFVHTPDWAHVRPTSTAALGPSGPVAPDELVDASGRCAPPAPKVAPQAEAAQAPAPETPKQEASPKPATPPAYGSVAGDLASAPMPQGPAPKPMPVLVKTASAAPDMDQLQPEAGAGMGGLSPSALLGGIALGMTECQAVRRGGQPSNVSIGVGQHGARKVVITYLSGQWPGIYTFSSGRLKEVDEVPGQQQQQPKGKQKRKYKKKPRHKPAQTARGEDVFVQ